MKKIFVTGGCGFIGSHFIDLLLKKNHVVLNLDALTYAATRTDLKHSNYTFKKGNIVDKKLVKVIINKFKPEIIINFAAESHVDKSIIGPLNTFKTNILGTLNLIENLRISKLNSRYIQVSTDEVFGALRKKDASFNEKSSYNPSSPYASSKAAADQIVNSYANTYNMETIITHCTNNFGPRQHSEKLIPLMLSRVLKNQSIPIYGKGQNIRDWIYVKDHCNIIYKIMNLKVLDRNRFFIGAANELTNIELTKKFLKILEKKTAQKKLKKLITYVHDRPGHDFRYSINNKFIINKFKYQFTNFDEAIEQTIDYYIKKFKKTKKMFYYDYSNIRQ